MPIYLPINHCAKQYIALLFHKTKKKLKNLSSIKHIAFVKAISVYFHILYNMSIHIYHILIVIYDICIKIEVLTEYLSLYASWADQ